MIETEEEIMAFDMYFASICSMQYHPGAGTKEHKKLSVTECRDMALEMLATRRELISKIVEE